MTRQAARPLPPLSAADIARFNSFVDRSGGPDACWPFTGHITKGYGQFSLAGHPVKAHRVAYFIETGKDPAVDGPPGADCVCHTCDNGPCCNPKHLWPGSNVANTADKVAKGRQASGEALGATIQPKARRGVDCTFAKLTPERVREMRTLAAQGVSDAELGRRFGVSTPAARMVRLRRTWAHVPEE